MMMMMMMKQLNMFPWFYLYVTVCLHYLLGCCLPVRPYSLDVGNSAGQTRSGGKIRWSMIPLNSPRYGLYVTKRNTHKRFKKKKRGPVTWKGQKLQKGQGAPVTSMLMLQHDTTKICKRPWFMIPLSGTLFIQIQSISSVGGEKKTSWMSMAINSTLRLRPSCLHTLIEARQESLEDPESKSSHEGLKMV